MLMVISPAKTLDYETPPVTHRFTQPQYLDHAQELIQQLRQLTPLQISELMKLSDKLAGLNAARYASWHPEFTPENAKQALLAFKGDVYTGLNAEDFGEDDFAFAQDHLRMLSGLYGVLRPLDLMQPYRLEMGTRLANARGKDLYAFWGERISQWLNEALAAQGDDVLLNLASNEYFGAVKRKALQARVIDTEFKDLKNGQYKIISFYAKKARGMMARYVIRERLRDPAGLKDFNAHGYYFSAEQSGPDQLVFLRDAPARLISPARRPGGPLLFRHADASWRYRSSLRHPCCVAFLPGKALVANRPTQPFVCKSCGTASHFFTPSPQTFPQFKAEMPSPA